MKYPGRVARILLSASVCFVLAGGFAYEEHQTVVPAVETPATTSSSTTTTSTVPNPNTTVESQHTTTYTNTSP
ncbi:MAG: hypothetical protein WB999_17370 [Candidatus Binataceae bacterium]